MASVSFTVLLVSPKQAGFTYEERYRLNQIDLHVPGNISDHRSILGPFKIAIKHIRMFQTVPDTSSYVKVRHDSIFKQAQICCNRYFTFEEKVDVKEIYKVGSLRPKYFCMNQRQKHTFAGISPCERLALDYNVPLAPLMLDILG
ncbi:hypothetical protein UY3_13258 [Chelonia mydas]|uniref:Uncharacterized protein n=1 Tax=Chelonia mydas TaxID=8469 RepID=M7B2B9_CHEMY|nr:hypothetical protein UY3_13258 [Chelonia mydas]